MLHRVVWSKFTDVSEVLAASIIRAMTEDSHIHTRRRENLKSYTLSFSPAIRPFQNFIFHKIQLIWIRVGTGGLH
jgi:hypothetical protein